MRRLVYTPRVYAFIKDSRGQIHDVSRYVTSGSVNRRIDAVSSAEITLRNPNKIFTTPKPDGSPYFSPMDPITIFLKRAPGRPVRVFTGFLDKTVYLQLFPGTISLRASCTLKKLLYTHFDPALPYTMSFLSAYGWYPVDGDLSQWVSPTAYNDFRREMEVDGKVFENNTGATLPPEGDGSLGQLLFATLKHIGFWDERQIYIESLPQDLFERLANLAQQFEEANTEAKEEFESMMRTIIGSSDYGGALITDAEVAAAGAEFDTESLAALWIEAGGDPTVARIMAAVAMAESGGDPNIEGPLTSYGFKAKGLWQIHPPEPGSEIPLENAKQAVRKYNAGGFQPWEAYTNGSYRKFLNVSQSRDNADTGASDDQPGNASLGRTGVTPHDKIIDKRSSSSGSDKTNRERLSPEVDVRGAGAGMMVILRLAMSMGLSITAGKNDHDKFTSSGNVSDHFEGWALDLSNGVLTKEEDDFAAFAKDKLGPMIKQLIWRDKIIAGNGLGGTVGGHQNHVHIALLPEYAVNHEKTLDAVVDALAGREIEDIPEINVGIGGGVGGGGGSEGAAGALFGAIEMPGIFELYEATQLQGDKSLMNDKPLMPFIQQLCEASLRHFQSTPDGKFFAFYPDYFGEMYQHNPYWYIDDIEILDGKIELSDDSLVTHMYVVGDTLNPLGTSPNALRSAFSRGVVTIFNAFMADSVLNRPSSYAKDERSRKKNTQKDTTPPKGMDILLKKQEANAFLKRYGARPLREDMPMIRHPAFEMMLAYQRFLLNWSKQFLTTFTFTFMPELFPGGKVGFPGHGLQMYIDEVTHTWDYTSGFTTQANLSAPSALGRNSKLPPNMVRAMIVQDGSLDADVGSGGADGESTSSTITVGAGLGRTGRG